MSGHRPHRGIPHRHPAHPAIWAAAAAIILLAAGACTSTTTNTSAQAVAAASTGPGGQKPALTGTGSTFDAPFFSAAFARYQQQHPGVTIGYSAAGSSAGIAAISAKQVDFGASDVPMTASEQAAATGGPITQVPVDLGGEGIVYNLSLPAGARLHLTGPVLAGIFLGQITRWNDPALAALNPGVTLPPAAITVVHRSDGSGTTYIFSHSLSSVSPAWAAKVGAGKTLRWPAGEGAEGNGGVATTVFRTPFSIGYVEQAYSKGLVLPFAAIRNQAGNYVIPSAQTVAADAAQKPGITSTDFSIVNQPGARGKAEVVGNPLAAHGDGHLRDGSALGSGLLAGGHRHVGGAEVDPAGADRGDARAAAHRGVADTHAGMLLLIPGERHGEERRVERRTGPADGGPVAGRAGAGRDHRRPRSAGRARASAGAGGQGKQDDRGG